MVVMRVYAQRSAQPRRASDAGLKHDALPALAAGVSLGEPQLPKPGFIVLDRALEAPGPRRPSTCPAEFVARTKQLQRNKRRSMDP